MKEYLPVFPAWECDASHNVMHQKVCALLSGTCVERLAERANQSELAPNSSARLLPKKEI